MKTTLIVAIAKNNAIGKDNDLLWHLPLDMAFFRRTTLNHHILTGRKNYESIPEKYRPLKNRVNLILTRNADYVAEGAEIIHSIEEGIQIAKSANETELYIIGGGQIYQSALESDLVDRMIITHVDGDFEADVFFPKFDESQWEKERIAHYQKDEKHQYNFEMISYTKKNR